jgi:heptosyltransferase-2
VTAAPPIPIDSPAPRPRLLVLELWGIGDLTFATAFLRRARARFEITLVGKAHARPLLESTFPDLEYLVYEAPWSAFRGKYHLWRWDWPVLCRLLGALRDRRFDAAVSVRNDPRDHLLMWAAGARRRFGFPINASEAFLTDPLDHANPKQHKVVDWRALGEAVGLDEMRAAQPGLDHARYRTPLVETMVGGIEKPILCLHAGARIPVRRWPAAYFAALISELRKRFHFHLLLIADSDDYRDALGPLADSIAPTLTLPELVDLLGRCDLLLCNDSGPGHIAASCGRPVIALFGPTDPDWFRPWGDQHHVVIRDLCPLRPCFDYCKYPEPYCLTRLGPEIAEPEVRAHLLSLIEQGALTNRLLKAPSPTTLLP